MGQPIPVRARVWVREIPCERMFAGDLFLGPVAKEIKRGCAHRECILIPKLLTKLLTKTIKTYETNLPAPYFLIIWNALLASDTTT